MANRIYNILSGLFFLLSLVWLVFVVVRFLGPPVEQPIDVALLPATRVVPSPTVPTNTPTFTPGPPTLPPTFTFTPSPTFTPTNTPTLTPTITPSATITPTPAPTDTPENSPTPTITPTLTPTITPTGPTPTFTPSQIPFPFVLRDNQVLMVQNTFNSAGCAYQGVGGQVFDLNGNEYSAGNLQVHVFNDTIDRVALVGSNANYGAVSGWEVPLGNAVSSMFIFVQLETINGAPVAERITIQFPGSCDRNVALVRFIQIR